MAVLDQIRKVQLIETPETVNANWATPSTSIDNRAGAFSVFFTYENGSSVNMTAYLQLSVDGENWASVDGSDIAFTDNSGTIIYDVDGSGTQYVRIYIEVTAGSIDVTTSRYSASQYH